MTHLVTYRFTTDADRSELSLPGYRHLTTFSSNIGIQALLLGWDKCVNIYVDHMARYLPSVKYMAYIHRNQKTFSASECYLMHF